VLADQFSYSEDFQVKVLAYMLSNNEFCEVAKSALTNELFANKVIQWFFDKLANAPIKLSPTTLQEELLRDAAKKVIRDTEVTTYVAYYNEIKKPPMLPEEQYIRAEMSNFIRTQSVKKAIVASVDLVAAGKWTEIVQLVTEATSKGMDIMTTGHDFFKDYQDRLAARMNEEDGRHISTAIPELDEYLDGGLMNKQLGMVAGATGRGKSIFLEWLAKAAVMLGKSVVYYSLEMTEEDISFRFDSLFSQIKAREVRMRNVEVFKAMSAYSAKFGSQLIIKEYPAKSITVEGIKAHYMQLSNLGIRPDLVIVDYLDLLKPSQHYNDMYQEQDYTTQQLHGLAKELNVAIWTAAQLNRSGITNEFPDETSISGAMAKLFTCDVAIFMAQSKDEAEDEIMRLIVTKNRNGPKNKTVELSTDYSRFTFYRKKALEADDTQ